MKAYEYVVVYDISARRERNRVFKLMKGFGQPIQRSVFECMLSVGDKKRLVKSIEALGLKTGWVKCYRLDYANTEAVMGVLPPNQIPGKRFDDDAAYIV